MQCNVMIMFLHDKYLHGYWRQYKIVVRIYIGSRNSKKILDTSI